jgi:hypothetical protein
MGTINPQVPVVGEPNSTEDPKITSAITTIRDAINGDLDNDNIATSANISGSKLADTSIATAKLADDAVTAAKILTGAVGSTELAALSVLSGKIPFVFQSGGPTITIATGVQASVASVLPGTYLVVGQVATNSAAHTLLLSSTGGAATITQPTSMYTNTERIASPGDPAYSTGFHIGRAVVTSTTTLQIEATRVSGTLVGTIYVFGVTAA